MLRGATFVAREKMAPCMLCRQPFSIGQLIEVDPKADETMSDASSMKEASSDLADKMLEKRMLGLLDTTHAKTIVEDDVKDLVRIFEKARQELGEPRVMDARFATLPSSFLSALRVATGIAPTSQFSISCPESRSPKIVALLRLVRDIKMKGEKVVVFSQQQEIFFSFHLDFSSSPFILISLLDSRKVSTMCVTS
jgi:hypothetical protein